MNIAIAGYGVEGQSNYRYWSQFPEHSITIVDEALELDTLDGVSTILGPGAFGRLNGFDLIIRTAGLAPHRITTDGKVWSATNEFFEKCPADIIGVTGSKGKGTTASLIASILEAAGRKVWLVGNIGLASLDVLHQIQPDDLVVYELSSFQLWDIERSPKTAVVLMIEQDHLDVHKDMDEYVAAKANIVRFQSAEDLTVYFADNLYSRQIGESSNALKIAYPDTRSAHVSDDHFYYGETKIASVSTLAIRGEHNVGNALAAINAVWSYTQDTDAFTTGLSSFKGLPHRLFHVRTLDEVEYYDDSIATTPTSASAALRSFSGHKVIILGGSSKGADFRGLAQELVHHDAIALLIGEEGYAMAPVFDAVGFKNFELIEKPNMPFIVETARRHARPGSVVLLSPAAASFGLFKNYADRGDQFIAAVNNLV